MKKSYALSFLYNAVTIIIIKNPKSTTDMNGNVTKPNSINDGFAQSTANGADEHGFIRSKPI
jgi:hypothetical protein